MKKLSIFAAALLALGFTSCVETDNPVDDGKTIIVDENGNEYKTDLIATFTGEEGAEVSLTLGVWNEEGDVYGIDFGDGNIVTKQVGFENKGPIDEEGNTTGATKFEGTIAGDGIVKVYGNSDLWYVLATGGIIPTTLDQAKLVNAVQVSITGANVEEVELPAMENLKQFNFNNSPLKSIDVSKATALTSLTINNTTASKYEPQLASIDVSKNTELTYLSLQGNNKVAGKLTSIDLTNNTKLENVYLQYNEIAEIKLADSYEKLTTLNIQNNKLTEFDTTKLPVLKSFYAADNELSTIDVSKCPNLAWFDVKNNKLEGDVDLTPNTKLTNVYVNNNQLTGVKVTNVTKQFYFDNNNMTISTMPDLPAGMNTTSKKKQFHHSPQAGVVNVALDFGVLDLSAEAKKKGIEAEEQATVFKFYAGDKELVEGTDYTGKDGKFTFLHSYDKIYGVMTTAAYPGLEIKTTEFATKTIGTDVQASEEVVYALKEGDAFKSDETVTVKDGVITITFGEAGGADFKAAKANASVNGYTAWTEGNGENGNKTGGTFYTIKPAKDGTVEVAVVLNAGKAFYILENDTALDDYNGIKVDEKYYGTYSFKVKAGNAYKVYCSGSKLGFYGFKFTY